MNRNIIRQIVDIQAQAERLITNDSDLIEIEDFAKYNHEIKLFLLQNIKDEFILKFINEIPDLKLDKIGSNEGVLAFIIAVFSNGMSSYYSEKQKTSAALEIIRDIRGKYASTEFMIKNYFS